MVTSPAPGPASWRGPALLIRLLDQATTAADAADDADDDDDGAPARDRNGRRDAEGEETIDNGVLCNTQQRRACNILIVTYSFYISVVM